MFYLLYHQGRHYGQLFPMEKEKVGNVIFGVRCGQIFLRGQGVWDIMLFDLGDFLIWYTCRKIMGWSCQPSANWCIGFPELVNQ